MKRLGLLIVLTFALMINVDAVSSSATVGSNLTEYSCSAFQEKNMHISGDTYFGRCMKATCNGSEWQLRYYSTDSVSCSNGNLNPYIKITKTGCSNYQNNSCSGNAIKYCTTISYFDCDRTSNGSKYTTTSKTTETTRITNSSSRKTSNSTTNSTNTTAPVLNNNTYLSNLTLSNGTINFNKEIREYSISVDSNVAAIKVEAIPEVNTSNVLVQGYSNLVEGANKITITVTAEDGSIGTYIINVNKESDASNNTNLTSLTIKGYDIEFNKGIYNYYVKTNESSLEIEAETEDINAVYMIEGNNNLKEGSVIKIVVTAADGLTTQQYTINIQKSNNSSGLVTAIFIGILVVAIGGGIYYFYTKKKNGGEKEYEYE